MKRVPLHPGMTIGELAVLAASEFLADGQDEALADVVLDVEGVGMVKVRFTITAKRIESMNDPDVLPGVLRH